MTWMRRLGIVVLNAVIASCASAPVHYHTLIVAPREAEAAPSPVSITVDVEPVRIPAQVDRLEVVVRRNDGEIALAESELWIAPLAEELRNAISVEIYRQLRSTHAWDAARKPSPMSVRLNVHRFESAPGHYALIDATWELRIKNATPQSASTCRIYAYERAGMGFAALVRAHQRAVVSIASQIASGAQRLATGNADACPAA
jgi:uncharacterized lipoprotein YmbA